MDPLTALSVAGTIVQFVDFGSKLLKNSVQLYKSSRGSLKAHEELEHITGDLQCVITKLRQSLSVKPSSSGEDEKDDFQERLVTICDDAAVLAAELLDKLNGLKVKDGTFRAWKSVRAAVRFAWSKDELRNLENRLKNLKEALYFGSTHLLGEKINADFVRSSSKLDSLEKQTREILEAVGGTNESFSRDICDFLARIICRSEAANQDEHQKTRQMIADMRDGNLSSSSSIDRITTEIEMLSVSNEEEEKLRASIGKNIVEALQYPHMTDRNEQLVEAHPATFDWIFCGSDQWEFPWSDFGKWLKDGKGIYWINGKPASGKSTLMKRIYDDRRTKEYLDFWSRRIGVGPGRCCLATFLFWSTGTTMQKGQEGLLRSLLFQILGQHPNLIPFVVPLRWAQYYTGSLSIGQQIRPDPWSSRELHSAFERLVCQKQYPLSICFCIDGLDEFSGNTEKLCLFFKRLSTMSDTVKVCLSSRPWVEFKHNFEDCASLRLQDLTFKDITTYVNDNLNSSAAFTQLVAREKELGSQLAEEIVNRAEGVFLWVKIVVMLLLRGINNCDTIPLLWARLRSFPTELSDLYESILGKIERIYFDWTSTAFQCMLASEQLSYDPFRKLNSSGAKEVANERRYRDYGGVSPLTLIEFSFALQDDYDIDQKDCMTTEQVISKLQETVVHLTVRCAGLLEIPHQDGFKDIKDLSSSFAVIRWMHRTAHDFVLDCKMWTKPLDEYCFRNSSVCFLLMKGSLVSRKELLGRPGIFWLHLSEDKEIPFMSNAITYAHYADGHLPSKSIRSMLLLAKAKDLDVMIKYPVALNPIQVATIFGIADFLEDLLLAQGRVDRLKSGQELLRLLCSFERMSILRYPYPTRKTLQCLIKFADLVPRRVRDVEWTRAGHPAVTKSWIGVGVSSKDNSAMSKNLGKLEVPGFIESHFMIIDTFLKADVDPTDSLFYLPRNFILPIGLAHETTKKCLENQRVVDFSISALLIVIKSALEEARLQSKRKRLAMQPQEVIEISDVSDSDDVIFLEERPVDLRKRIKVGEDD